MVNARIVEVVAAMAKYHPFFEKEFFKAYVESEVFVAVAVVESLYAA